MTAHTVRVRREPAGEGEVGLRIEGGRERERTRERGGRKRERERLKERDGQTEEVCTFNLCYLTLN